MGQPPAGVALRWGRALVVSVVALGLGIAGHVSAGGLLPGPGPILLALGTAVVVSAAALERRASYGRLAALVAGGQAFTHAVLTALAGHAAPHAVPRAPSPVAGSDPSGTVGGGAARQALLEATGGNAGAGSGGGVGEAVGHFVADMSATNGLMGAAHLAAACLVAAWLWVGENAVWTLLSLLGRRAVRWSTSVATPVGTTAPEPMPVAVRPSPRWTSAASRGPAGVRGPPSHPTSISSASAA